jgi:hypothetical protein
MDSGVKILEDGARGLHLKCGNIVGIHIVSYER